MMSNDSNAVWPGWKTVRMIGRGSFGAVYEIERDVLGEKEKAALKVITIPQSSGDIDELYGEGYDEASITSTFAGYLKNIVAEYSLMRKMNGSANVVSCDDVRYVQHDDGIGWDIFIKMELLTALPKALGKEVGEEQVIRIGEDICKALVLCKKRNIIHRDIKPGNIFVSEDGDYKLGDFGIAKTVEKTSGGTKIGTYEYMAPEVYHDEPYGSTVDIYSLGMVLYWLLNERRTPFLQLPPALPSNSDKEKARKRRFSGEAIPAPAHGSDALKAVVLKAVAYDEAQRYQTPEELLAALEAVEHPQQAAEPAVSRPKEPTPPVREAEEAPPKVFIQDPEEATVGAFSRTLRPEAPAEQDPEEATVGVYQKPAAPEPPPQPVKEKAAEEPPVGKAPPQKPGPIGGTPEKPASKAKPKPIVFILSGVAALVVLLVVGFFTIHIWTPGSCTEPQVCRICGKARSSEAGHQWIAATCTSPQVCAVCGTVGSGALGHDWTAATCTEPKTCARCGETTGTALGHDWSSATCTDPKTCLRCGLTEASALGHTWVAATCTDPKTCSRCGTTEGNALGHNWNAATCTSAKTCSRCGTKEGSALGHDWLAATYDKPSTCRRCGITTGNVKGYIGDVSVHWGENSIVWAYWIIYPMVFDSPIENCRRATVHIDISIKSQYTQYSKYTIYYKNDKGEWLELMPVTLVNGKKDVEIFFDKPTTILAYVVYPAFTDTGDIWEYYYYYMDEVQVY